ERANVSIGTVDRVLHDRGEVAEITKRKILQIVKDLNYQPNLLASTLASKKPYLFATLFPAPPSSDGYWNKPAIGVKKRIQELNQFGVDIQPFTFNQAEPKSFIENAEKILSINPEGIVFAPFFKKESESFIEQLKERNIPFVFIDSEIKLAGQLGYVGQNSYQSGMVSGKLLDLILPEGNILVMHFAKEMDNQNHLVQREKGFYNWFKKNKQTTRQLYTTEISDTSSDIWMDQIVNTIHKKNIKGIFVTNSKVYYAGRLVEKFGWDDMKVIGHDLLRENVLFLKKNLVQFLICQRPEEQGYNSINKLFKYIVQKKGIAKENYTSIDIVTKENVDFYKEF
ncbi:MAG: substrate-binding domain-containing protein, partial [Mariniphaga sp.]|nr:substrate-binding domain-containing protein [Mariniphaga sp.]